MRRIQIIFFLMMVFVKANAQDPHFTQINRVGTMINPAVALTDNNNLQVTMLYRTQWNSLAPFKTQGIAFNKKVNRFTFDANVINNTAGTSGFKQFYFNGGLSYNYKTKKNSFLGGIQMGIIQHSFNPLNMTFDDQFIPDVGYSPSNTTQEVFTNTKSIRPDFNLGGLWVRTAKKEKLKPFVGFALSHINQPKETFLSETSKTKMKSNLYGGFVYPISEDVQLQTTCYFLHQGNSNELITAAIAKINLEENKGVEGGVVFRTNDAIAIYSGYQMLNWMVGVSYDINVSGLTTGNGAFELTLTYQPKAKVKEPKKIAEKQTAKALKDSTDKQTWLMAVTMNPKPAKPIIFHDAEQMPYKENKVTLTKPLVIPDKEELALFECKKIKVINATNETKEYLLLPTKVSLTAPLIINDREEIAMIPSKPVQLTINNQQEDEQLIIQEEKTGLSQPIVIADRVESILESLPNKKANVMKVTPSNEELMAIEKQTLSAPLMIQDREEISTIPAITQVKLVDENDVQQSPSPESAVAITLPIEIPETIVRDSAPVLIKKNVEMVIITESDNDLQIVVSPAVPLTAPKVVEENSFNNVSTNFMTFTRNSASVDQIQVIDVLEPVYDSLWFNKNYQVTLVADSRDKEQLNLPRLKAVQNVLMKKGVSKDRIKLVMKDDELNTGAENYSGAVYLKVQSVK
ncbi:MAG: PorP/SprF family type IX secretion system membrane protein [Bacteroidota bacterium]